MVTDVVFDPLLPVWTLAALGAASTLFLALAIWRGLAGWGLRALSALVILAALVNPSLRHQDQNPLSDIVLVVVDRSSSQSIAARPEQIDAALSGMKKRLGALNGIDVKTIIVKDAPPNSDAGTLLMTALAKATATVSRARIAGAIVITDGEIHDMELAPSDFPAPVQVLLSGQKNDWDRRIVITNAPAFAILGEPVSLRLKVEDLGHVPSGTRATTDLVIAVDGGPDQHFQVTVGQELTLPVHLAHGGQNVLQFSVPVVERELTDRNNTAVVAINGVRDRLRVLLVSGEPHAGERTWRNLLKSDSSVDLVHFTILRPPGKQDGVPVNELSLIAFPTRELFLDKIDQFDLIIFDRYRRRGILPSVYLENVARYVEKGGTVLVDAGPAFAGVESLYRSPLARILPARPTSHVFQSGFLPLVSKIGKRHPVTQGLEKFAPRPIDANGKPGWGRWFRMVDLKPRSGNVVMTGAEGHPLLVLDRVGKGRVALLASDQVWLWNRGFEGGGPQLELLRRLAHWMLKEPDLEEEALSAKAHGRSVIVTRRSLTSKARDLVVTAPNGTKQTLAMEEVEPGRYVARFDGTGNGLYRLREGSLTTVIALGPAAPKEFENPISTPKLIAPLIAATHGGSHRLSEGIPDIRFVRAGHVASGRGWIGLTRRGAFVTTGIRLQALATALLFVLLASLLLVAAWWREGK